MKFFCLVLSSILFVFNMISHGDDFRVISVSNSSSSNEEELNLFTAVKNNFITITKLLLNSGVNVNENFNGTTALHVACKNNYEEIVKILIRAGADLNKEDSKGYSPLQSAIYFDHANIVRILIKSGANLNKVNPYGGKAALHYAVLNLSLEIIDLLLQRGAKVDSKDLHHNTPLYLLYKVIYKDINKSEEIAKLLLSYGADINAQDTTGLTLLHRAVVSNSLKIVEMLLKYEADPLIIDSNNRNAIELAEFLDYKYIANLIRSMKKIEEIRALLNKSFLA